MKAIAVHKVDNISPKRLRLNSRAVEQCLWLLLLMICNYGLLHGQVAEHYVFVPSVVASGEWLRLILSSFTHVSWYHLLLDAGAFLLLWKGLEETSSRKRLMYWVGCWVGSLLIPLLASTSVYQQGLCGLSGISHGLFAVTALELLVFKQEKVSRQVGALFFSGLLLKVLWEVVAGDALLLNLHFGDIGLPIVSSHLGGFLGGVLIFAILNSSVVLAQLKVLFKKGGA